MRVLRWVLLTFGVVFLLLANILLWVDTTLFNSERFAGAVDETMAKPEVQDRLATVISQEAAKELDVQSQLQERLPDDLKFIALFAGNEIEETVLYRVSQRLLSSGFTAELRSDVIERLHRRVVAILESEDTALQVEGDDLVLDLRPVVTQLFERVGVSVPARVQEAQAEGRGVVVLMEDTSGLQAAAFFVRNRAVFVVIAFVLGLACFAGAVLMHTNRMSGVSRAGFAVATVGILTLLLVLVSNQFIPDERIVLRELVQNLEANLRRQSIGLVLLGAIVVAVADPGVRRSFASARRSVDVYSQRLGTGTPLLVAMGLAGLVLFLV